MSAPVPTSSEYLEIDSVPLHCHGWTTENLFVMWQGPDVRGQDILIPGAAGVRPKPRRATVSTRSLFLSILGDFDGGGTRYDDPRIGLLRNIDYLRENVADPTGVGDGTRTATLHLPDGSTRSGLVHVEDFQFEGDGPGLIHATLDLTIVSGALS